MLKMVNSQTGVFFKMDLSIVIPCYNEEETLAELCLRVKKACETAPVKSYEIIIVNDGSTDQSLAILRELSKKEKSIIVIDLAKNYGQQMALSAGLEQSKGEHVLILDADLQDPPELLPNMLEKAKTGVDVVYGQRRKRAGESWIKLATARMFYRVLSYLSDVPIPENVGDFRLLSRRVVEHFLNMPERHRYVRGMISWVGFKQEPILYDRDARFAGETKYTLTGLAAFAVDAITSFSIKPLRLCIPFAFLGALLALGLGIYAFTIYFTKGSVPGWPSLACIVTFFSSLQLICIGLIGEYVGRIYMQVKGRPLYIVREVIGSSK